MVPRMLVARASDFQNMNALDWVSCISTADGRTVAAEVACNYKTPVDGVSHGELAVAMGADIIIQNFYDLHNPKIDGCPEKIFQSEAPLSEYKRLIGCPVGVNFLIGQKEHAEGLGGRNPTPENIELALNQGADMFFLYAIRRFGCTLDLLYNTVREMLKVLGDKAPLFVNNQQILAVPRNDETINKFMESDKELLSLGCHGIILPMPCTKRGWMLEPTAKLIDGIKANNGLAWLIMGESIPGAPADTMHQMALQAKMLGADVCMIDYSGIYGMADLMNIFEFSLAYRGKTHTFFRMASSILR